MLVQSYGFDGVGNLISSGNEFLKVNGSQAKYTETFTYDGMHRVQYVDFTTGTPPTTTRTHTYGYNQIGNFVSKDGQAFSYTRTVATEPLAPHAVRSALGAIYQYDANGNMTGSDAGSVVTWRTFNQPDEIKKVSPANPAVVLESSKFTYGADEERIIQDTQDGTQTRYVGSLYEVTVPQGNTSLSEVRAYVMTPFGRTVVLQFNNSGSPVSTRYLTQNQIGSTSVVTDEAGRVRERFSYDPWGAPRDAESLATSAPWPTRLATTRGFTDHEMLSRLSLVHMNGRIYNPALGRFLSPDPFINDADGTQQLNRYTYVRNNPLSLNDPTGYQTPNSGDIVEVAPVVVTTTPLPKWGTSTWIPLFPTVGVTTGLSTSQSSVNQFSPNSGSFGPDSARAFLNVVAPGTAVTGEEMLKGDFVERFLHWLFTLSPEQLAVFEGKANARNIANAERIYLRMFNPALARDLLAIEFMTGVAGFGTGIYSGPMWSVPGGVAGSQIGSVGVFSQLVDGRIRSSEMQSIARILRQKHGTQIYFDSEVARREGNHFNWFTNEIHLIGGAAKQRRGLFYEEVQHAFDYHAGAYPDGLTNFQLHAITARNLVSNPLLPTTPGEKALLLELAERWAR